MPYLLLFLHYLDDPTALALALTLKNFGDVYFIFTISFVCSMT